MVRIQTLDKGGTMTYDKNIRISTLADIQRQVKYLRIKVNGETIITIELNKLQWVSESSTRGVATMRSSSRTIIMIYNSEDKVLCDFFGNLQRSLSDQQQASLCNSDLSSTKQDQSKPLVDNLIKSIRAGALDETERLAYELAKQRVNIQFTLGHKNAKFDKKRSESKSDDGSVETTNSILQLTLRVEWQSKRKPIVAPIKVRCGTTLQSLKERIENETNIKLADQFWFAFNRYPIPDEYVFGSSVSARINHAQYQPLPDPIRSGDTLIMYIAQTSPVY